MASCLDSFWKKKLKVSVPIYHWTILATHPFSVFMHVWTIIFYVFHLTMTWLAGECMTYSRPYVNFIHTYLCKIELTKLLLLQSLYPSMKRKVPVISLQQLGFSIVSTCVTDFYWNFKCSFDVLSCLRPSTRPNTKKES